MPIPSGFVSHIDLLDPLCYPGSGLIIEDLASPSTVWNISASGTSYNSTVGAISLTTQSIEADTQLINTGDGPITIAGWVNINLYSYGTSFNCLPAVGKALGGNQFKQLALYGSVPNAVGLGNCSNGSGFVYGNVESPINTWVFVVVKKNTGQTTSQYKTYINGVPNEAGYAGSNVTTSIAYNGTFSYGLINGTIFGDGASALPMTVSQYWMYNSYLSDADVLDLYNATKNRYATPITELDFLNPACFPGSGTSITDLSGNNSNFTLNNTSYTYDPVIGALTLPSGTYADGIAADFVFGTNPVTINAWVKFNTSSPGINICQFGGDNPGERTQFYWRSSDNFIVSDNAGAAGGWVETADNQWHLLSLTRPSSSLCGQQNAYIDGVLITNNPVNFYNPSQALNGSLGAARIHASSDPLEIATFDVWDVEQTAGEILAYYNSTSSRFSPSPPPPSSNGVGGRQFAQGFNG
jgi:hypothetical protein